MSEQFTTRLQAQLREAALREEQRGALGRRVAGARYRLPRPATLAAAAFALLLVAVVIALGGVRWGGEQTTTIGPRVIEDLQLGDNLGGVAPGFGSVWISDAHGTLLRLDPRTRTVQQRIRVGGDPNAPGGTPNVNAGAGAVWAVAQPPSPDRAPHVMRIDPRSGRVTANVMPRTPAGRPLRGAVSIEILAGRPWLVAANGVLELDPRTARPTRFIRTELPAGEPYPLWLTGDAHNVWEITRDGRILRYDLASGRLAATVPVRLAGTTALIPTAAGPVVATRDGQLALTRASDGTIAWQRKPGDVIAGVVQGRGDLLYIHAAGTSGGRDRVVVLSTRTGDVRSATTLPQFGLAGMSVVGHELWMTTPTGHLLVLRL
jgi:hypothetical protein